MTVLVRYALDLAGFLVGCLRAIPSAIRGPVRR